jgi:cell pole-organizing protein PopZ
VRSAQEAGQVAATNNPTSWRALRRGGARDNINIQLGALLPTLSLQGQAFRNDNQLQPHTRLTGGQITANLSVPIYQGGAEYAVVRQARQQAQQFRQTVDEQRRNAVQQATQAWEQFQSSRAQVDSQRAAIRAAEIALDGVQREAIVGSRTTLEVLNQEQELLSNRVNLVRALTTAVLQSYSLAAALGRLTAQDLGLDVEPYDMRAYYNAVRNRWAGLGDYSDVAERDAGAQRPPDGDRRRRRPAPAARGAALMAEPPPPAGPAPAAAAAPGRTPPAGDPSMEDILASIRRILNEDEPPAAGPSPPPPAGDEPLDLTRRCSWPARPRPRPPAVPGRRRPADAAAPAAPRPAAERRPAQPPAAQPAPPAADSLLAPAAAAAATASLGHLLRTVAAERGSAVRSGGPTIEDVVREELRPLLKEWLDQHLPGVVERLVRAEIERVVGRALS